MPRHRAALGSPCGAAGAPHPQSGPAVDRRPMKCPENFPDRLSVSEPLRGERRQQVREVPGHRGTLRQPGGELG